MYKFFFEDRVVILTDNRAAADTSEQGAGLFYPFKTTDDMERLVELFRLHRSLKKVCVYSLELEAIKNKFIDLFENIKAAGAVIRNRNNDIFVLRKKGLWDLPKINIEEDEITNNELIIRKIEAQFGFDNLKITKLLPSTYHTFEDNSQRILKQIFWFELIAETDRKDSKEVKTIDFLWVKPIEIIKILKNTHLSLFEVFEAAILGKVHQDFI